MFGRKRLQNSMEMSWHFDGIPQDFYEKRASPSNAMRMSWNFNVIQWIKNLGSFWWYFYGESPWNCHGIWRHFRPKLWRESMTAFYYEGSFWNSNLIFNPQNEAEFSIPLNDIGISWHSHGILRGCLFLIKILWSSIKMSWHFHRILTSFSQKNTKIWHQVSGHSNNIT